MPWPPVLRPFNLHQWTPGFQTLTPWHSDSDWIIPLAFLALQLPDGRSWDFLASKSQEPIPRINIHIYISIYISIYIYLLYPMRISYMYVYIYMHIYTYHLYPMYISYIYIYLYAYIYILSVQFSSNAQSYLTLQPHGLQHTRLPCPSSTPGACSNSRPLSWWCHPTVSSSVISFSSCPQSFPASGSFLMSQFFASGDQSIGTSASASVFPMNIQDWFPLVLTSWISLQSKEIPRVFFNTVQKHQFFSTQLSL